MGPSERSRSLEKRPIVIIGGGVGGLATAAYLARAGRYVTVYEKSSELGGRARTDAPAGYRLNAGPHALYLDGAGATVLRDLGVEFTGGKPDVRGGYALRDGRAYGFPSGFFSLLTTGLLGLSDKIATARILASLPTLDLEPLRDVTVRRPQADCAREVCHASYAALRVGIVQAAERGRPAPAPASVPYVISTRPLPWRADSPRGSARTGGRAGGDRVSEGLRRRRPLVGGRISPPPSDAAA